MYKVSILLDPNNNWLNKYIFKETFSNNNYTIDIVISKFITAIELLLMMNIKSKKTLQP